MFERIAHLYEMIEHLEEAASHIRALDDFKKTSAEIEKGIELIRTQIRGELYKIVKSYLDGNGEEKTVEMLFRLKGWHPWSYKYFHEIWELLRLKGDKSVTNKMSARLFPTMRRS